MAGTRDGAAKAHQTKIKKDPDFYRKIGRLSWKNDRSHAVGFALMDPETRRELGQKGGKKTKKDYKKDVDTPIARLGILRALSEADIGSDVLPPFSAEEEPKN